MKKSFSYSIKFDTVSIGDFRLFNLFVYLFIYLFTCLFVCLFVYLFIDHTTHPNNEWMNKPEHRGDHVPHSNRCHLVSGYKDASNSRSQSIRDLTPPTYLQNRRYFWRFSGARVTRDGKGSCSCARLQARLKKTQKITPVLQATPTGHMNVNRWDHNTGD